DVDGVVAGACAHYELHWSRVEHWLSHFRAANDQHVGRRRFDRLDQRVVFQIRLKRNLATERLQPISPGLFEFICYENSHAFFPVNPEKSGKSCLNRVYQQTVSQLWLKPRRLRRHDLVCRLLLEKKKYGCAIGD